MSDKSFQDQFSDINSRVEYLKQSRLFSPFSEELLFKLSPLFKLNHFPESHEITREGESRSEIFFLIRGKVSVYSAGEFILTLRRLGDICGEMSMLRDRPDFSTDIAGSDVDMFSLEIDKLYNSPDINGTELKDLLEKLCSAMLTDRLALAIKKARHYEESDKQLKQAIEASQKADRARSNFLANISHELRTPMHGVIGMSDLLLNTELTSEQEDYTRIIQHSATNLQRRIDDLVNISDLERGDLYISNEPFDLHLLMDRMDTEMRSIAENKNLLFSKTISPDVPRLLRGDPVRLHQILRYLIGNAIKFTRQGSVEIEISQKRDSEQTIRLFFTIKDTGIGIDEAHFDTVFKPFTQGDSSTAREFDGIGLGLAISKQLVELMGGEIGFDTTVDTGTSFWFQLKLNQQEDRRGSKNLIKDGHRNSDKMFLLDSVTSTPARILVVDHDRVNRLVAVKGLQDAGCHIESIDTGDKAIRILELLPFDLVLINIYLPDNDGLKTTRKIRQRDSKVLDPAIPILGMTSHIAECSRNKKEFAGLTGLIQKPLTRETLQQAVSQWLFDVEK